MKKYNLSLLVALLLVSFGSAYSQQVRMSLQGGYGSEIEKGAVGIGFEIFLIDKFSFAPGVNFYIPAEKYEIAGDDLKISYWEFNADLHYYPIKTESFGLYAILGLNVMTVKAKYGDESESENETGANIGFGISVGPGLPFVEAKYESVGEGQFFIGGGFRFPLN